MLTVLAYHRIDHPGRPGTEHLAPDLIDSYPEEFEAQMRWLKGRYNAISGWELVDALQGRKPLPPRALMITFDDAYRSFAEIALPILRRHSLPVTLFVTTKHAENPHMPFWWDALHHALHATRLPSLDVPEVGTMLLATAQDRRVAYEKLVGRVESLPSCQAERLVACVVEACDVRMAQAPATLGWDEIARIVKAGGVTTGPHTRRHPLLSRTDAGRMKDEIQGSWQDLRYHIQEALPLFAYPNGQSYAINEESKRAVAEAGLVGAFTMLAGHNRLGYVDRYLLHRIGGSPGQSLGRFRLRVSRLGSLLRGAKSLLHGAG